jgi:hypothetical protein
MAHLSFTTWVPFLGYLTLNLWGAYRIGVRFHPSFDLAHPGLREWIRLSLPLMLGVTVVTADKWILNYATFYRLPRSRSCSTGAGWFASRD